MDDIIEFILEFLFDFGSEVSKDKKVSKWIRYPLIVLLVLFFLGVTGLILFCGFACLKENVLAGIFFLALGLFFLIGGIYKFRKEYMEKKK